MFELENFALRLSNLNILLGILGLALAGIFYFSNRTSRTNFAIAVVVSIQSFLMILTGSVLTTTTQSSYFVLYSMNVVLLFSLMPSILYSSLVVFRPKVANIKLVRYTLYFFILIPLIATIIDISGVSQVAFGQPLFIDYTALSNVAIGTLDSEVSTLGILAPYIRRTVIIFSGILFLYPLLPVIFKERRTAPEKFRYAIVLFIAVAIAGSTPRLFENLPNIADGVDNLISSAALTLAYGYIMFSEVRSKTSLVELYNLGAELPMYNKLLLINFLIIFPTVLLLTIVSLNYLKSNVARTIGEDYTFVARTGAEAINNTLGEITNNLQSLSNNPDTRSVIELRANSFTNARRTDIEEQIEQAEQIWQRRDPTNFFINSILDPERAVFLNDFLSDFPEFDLLIITDTFGGTIVATQYVDNYLFSDQVWWRFTKNNNLPFIGPPTYDPETGSVFIEMTEPVSLNNDGQIDAVIYARLNGSAINQILVNSQSDGFGELTLFNNSGEWMPLTNPTGRIDPGLNWNILTSDTNKRWQYVLYQGEDSIAAWHPIGEGINAAVIGWNIVAHTPQKEAFDEVTQIRNANIFLSLGVFAGSIGLTTVLARLITRPLNELNDVANRILNGERGVTSDIEGKDEIGTLAASFNSMTTELSALVNSLESTVEERTKSLEKRAVQLETSAEVAREAASISNVRQLLTRITELISDRFGYYHCGIFLLDSDEHFAVLHAANSDGGQRMLARGHKLEVGRVGVVGYAAGNAEARIAQDVGADVVYYDNPDMPATKSELALPMIVRGDVIGVLDVQSVDSNAFSREDVLSLQLLADQVGLAIENTRLLETSQTALLELERLYGQQGLKAWQARLSGQELNYRYSPTGLQMGAGPTNLGLDDDQTKIARELLFRGQPIGQLELARQIDAGEWSEEEITLIEEILDQTALALENARLVDEIRLRSDQIGLLQEITALAATLPEEIELLTTVAEKLQYGFELDACNIEIFNESKTACTIVANAPSNEYVGQDFSIIGNEVTLEVIRTQQVKALYDIANNPSSGPAGDILASRGITTWIILPLIVRGETIGAINLEISDPNRIVDDEALNLFNQISAQVSTALDSVRLLDSEQRGRQAASALLEITQIAGSSLDLNYVLREVTQRSAAALEATRCSVFLLNEDKTILNPLISMYAEPDKVSPEMWERFKDLRGEELASNPLFQQAFERRRPFIHDAQQGAALLPNRWVDPFGVKNTLAIPLVSQDQVLGMLAFDHTESNHTFTQEEINLGQTIAGQIATTIENANLFDQTVRRARRDRLVAEITSKLRSSNDPNAIMETAVDELRGALQAVKTDGETNAEPNRQPSNGTSNKE